jgi:hypothetical protein
VKKAHEPRTNRAVPIKAALEGLLKNMGLFTLVQEQKIIAHWPEIIGADLAKICTPLKIEKGTLWLRVENSCWRNEMLFRQGEFIRRANEYIGKPVLKHVMLVR